MKIEEILALENANDGATIHLVRDRVFWQAWERSAFLFVNHVKPYKITAKFVKKVGGHCVLLGFPNQVLATLEKMAGISKWRIEKEGENLIKVIGLPQIFGFEEWKEKLVAPQRNPPEAPPSVRPVPPPKGTEKWLAAYKSAYDLSLHIQRATVKMAKEYRYELGTRVRAYAMNLMEELHLLANGLADPARSQPYCRNWAHRLRIDLRVLWELNQISAGKWGMLNQQTESLLNSLWVESCGFIKRPAGEILGKLPSQSSGALAPAKPETAAEELRPARQIFPPREPLPGVHG
jgi:hypothetical protein